MRYQVQCIHFLLQGEQQLWATGLNISYGDLTSLYGLLNYVTDCKTVQGELLLPVKDEVSDPINHLLYYVPTSLQYSRRYAVLSNQLYHSNLAVLQYPVFFQICKAHLIGYDMEVYYITVLTYCILHTPHHVGTTRYIVCTGREQSEREYWNDHSW